MQTSNPNSPTRPRLLTEADFCELTQLSPATARTMRCRKIGPSYIKLGASVRYSLEVVQEWISSRRVTTESVAA